MLKRVFVAASLALAAFAPLPAGAQGAQTETVVVVPLERLPVYGSVVSAWYKQPVYDPNEKKLGSIADMLFSADGSINAVMLNVGGFLGLGVKHIAIPVSAITITQKNNKSWLTLNTTKDLLKKALAYKFDKATGLWDPI
ncbi:PRC-barrel domain-containing protein [Methylocystis sp. H62]|uniref:PRC-barrel domain-containing protein n=1 Tax=Methylocystis sp. H62 TaxID=2785789 RepID=UPI0011DBE73C|nr:PRC-barrel domain-containing protein [Methylocystis sp. H62]KAF0125845.1 MAG: PRC-barrel domain-containing protein [Methylocystaceae bacterium]KAF0213554.1 MAG: PRC-barrel domain-containing [Methylocystaceae bacterium]MBG0793816.1 PRC-barrel domain-containing protein [Methylocystis sp. H62]TXT44409.1 MAG: PRC-barrel domain-containing protein [Methylocystaceae bacterium]